MARSSERAALRRSTLGMERLEIRAVMAVDGPGVFAEQAGVRAGFTLGVSHAFTVRWQDFQPAASGRVLLEIHATVGDDQDRFAELAVSSPAGVRQMEAADGSLLARVGPRSHVVSARFGWAAYNARYAIRYRLAGDVDGSFSVTAADLDAIGTGMRTPAALTRQQFAAADVDGNRRIDDRDLRLATSNLGAATSLRPLRLDARIGPDTPSHRGVVRLPTSDVVATTTAPAAVLFANAATGERLRRQAGPDAAATAGVRLAPATANRIDVTAEDGFGQRVARQVVVQQRPTPVVIVPGWATSMPADPFDIPDFLFHRGYPAAKLAATWLVYGPLQDQLAAAGYAKGRDQFLVPYDWRLPIAPFDGGRDGLLSLATAAAILAPEPTCSLGYLGTFLGRLVADDPSIVSVDMLGHSNGGLLARAYVQSPAHGATFATAAGSFALPTVGRLLLVATPSLGSAISVPFWNNDTSSFTLPLLLADLNLARTVLDPVYQAVVEEAAVVGGPDGIIDRAAITDPVTGRPDPLVFLRRYLPSLRDLLPTFDVLRDAAGGLTNLNATPDANHLLLDLNAGSSPGVNPWAARVGEVIATFGVHPLRWFTRRPVATETFVRPVVADGSTGSIWPFQSGTPITPPAGTLYHVKESLVAGDDMVPAASLVATFAGDPRITVRAWGNGQPKAGLDWVPTEHGVRHADLLGNPDVLAFLRRRLRRPQPPA